MIRIKILRKIFLKSKILSTQNVKKQKIVIVEREQKENQKAIQLFVKVLVSIQPLWKVG